MAKKYYILKEVDVNDGAISTLYVALPKSTDMTDPNFELNGLGWKRERENAYLFGMLLIAGSLATWLCNGGFRVRGSGLFAQPAEDTFETIKLYEVDDETNTETIIYEGSYYKPRD